MRKILSFLPMLALIACASLHSPPVSAATITVSWDNPTTNRDGSDIPTVQGDPEALQTWRIEYGTCLAGNVFGTKAGEFVRTRAVGGPEITTATNNVPPGLTCTRVFVANTAGNESFPSNVLSKTTQPSTPNSPTNVR
jgi:hypothetical protein